MKSKIFVGTSGYSYQHWRGIFYPEDLPEREWLEYYAKHFNTVELNVSFYRLPKKEVFKGWRKRTPKDFIFSVKGSRFITHIKKLKDCEEPLETFFKNALGLKEKLKVVLWQLPARFKVSPERLTDFCKILKKKYSKNIHHAFEFRDESWFCDEICEILKKYNFGLVIAHSRQWPVKEIITADFVYLRFHGGEELYGSEYSSKELCAWAEKVKKWRPEVVYSYFNNDARGFAVKNAKEFQTLLK